MSDNPFQSPPASETAGILGMHILAPLASCLGTFLLITSLSQVHTDRTHRQPVVTYVGPLSSWMPELIYMGLALSLAGFLAGAYLVNRYRDEDRVTPPTFSAAVAMMVASVNAMGSLLAWGAIWED